MEMDALLRLLTVIDRRRVIGHSSESLICGSSEGGHQASATLHADEVEAQKLGIYEYGLTLFKKLHRQLSIYFILGIMVLHGTVVTQSSDMIS